MKNKTLSEKRKGYFMDGTGIHGYYFLYEDVKQFIKEILELLDYDVNIREEYLYEKIKKIAGDLVKNNKVFKGGKIRWNILKEE